MRDLAEIAYQGIDEKKEYEEIVQKVIETCFKEENLYDSKMYISIIISNENYIKEINLKHRGIDSVTDVLSFPMFEKDEIEEAKVNEEVLGDIIICIPRVKEQAKEYGHSEEREFAYMIVHGFYHLMGYDHMNDKDKIKMRAKEENVLNKLGIERK